MGACHFSWGGYADWIVCQYAWGCHTSNISTFLRLWHMSNSRTPCCGKGHAPALANPTRSSLWDSLINTTAWTLYYHTWHSWKGPKGKIFRKQILFIVHWWIQCNVTYPLTIDASLLLSFPFLAFITTQVASTRNHLLNGLHILHVVTNLKAYKCHGWVLHNIRWNVMGFKNS